MHETTLDDRLARLDGGDVSYANMDAALAVVQGNDAEFARVHASIRHALTLRVAAIERLMVENASEGPDYLRFMQRHRDRFAAAEGAAGLGLDATLVDGNGAGIVIPGSFDRNTQTLRDSYLGEA